MHWCIRCQPSAVLKGGRWYQKTRAVVINTDTFLHQCAQWVEDWPFACLA